MASFADISLDSGMAGGGLPAAVEAERTILGAILQDPNAFYEASEKLRAEDFSLDSHRRIYAALTEQIETTQSTDVVRLGLLLQNKKEIDAVGGTGYLWSLTEGLPRRISIEQYVRIVRDKSLLRNLMLAASEAMTRAADQSEDALDVLNAVEQRLMELSERGTSQGFFDVPQIVANSFGSIDALVRQGREIRGLQTFYTDLDKITSGLQPSELIILAARPSMGKTALAINIAENVAIEGGGTVGIFSLEMSKESLLRRMLSAQSEVSLRELTGFNPGKEKFDKLVNGLDRLTQSRIYIDDTPGISLAEMRAKARRLKQQVKGLDLIVVDYLQLMSASPSGSRRSYENRTQEVSAISRGLKILAKELRVPVLALSQLSRASEARGGDKKPMLSDLRESGSIEQDADVVMFIHREDYYDREDPAKKGKAEVIIAKQRNGPTGSVRLSYRDAFTRFENSAYDAYQDNAPQ
jgi:replicative DNA helicase